MDWGDVGRDGDGGGGKGWGVPCGVDAETWTEMCVARGWGRGLCVDWGVDWGVS